jgi:hypothetical protein
VNAAETINLWFFREDRVEYDQPLARRCRSQYVRTPQPIRVTHPLWGSGVVRPGSEQNFATIGLIVRVDFEDPRFSGAYSEERLQLVPKLVESARDNR